MRTMTRARRWPVAVTVAVGLVVGAATTASSSSGTSDTEPTSSAATSDEASEASDETRTITHEQGTVEVPADPQRIVSVGYEEQQMILHFGKVPLMVRDYTEGTQPFGVWPWDAEYLEGAEPETFVDDLPYERIAELEPDLIMAVNGGLEPDQYERLTEIAPTVAQPVGYGPWDAPTEVQFLFVGEVFGMEDEAQQMLDDTDEMLADIAADHPEWSEMTAATLSIWPPIINADNIEHGRGQMLAALGFQEITEDVLPYEEDYPTVPIEQIDLLDNVDILLWMDFSNDPEAMMDTLPLRDALVAHEEGREIYVNQEHVGAFTRLPHAAAYLVEWLVPELEAAADADPSTPVPSAVEAGLAPG